jgi:hypothetical protein
MDGIRALGSGLSLLGTLFHLGVVVGMDPFGWSDRRSRSRPVEFRYIYLPPPNSIGIWTPRIENLGEGRPAFLGSRCPGRQQTGTPFRILNFPLPDGYDPHDFPGRDVVACVWLSSRGAVQGVRLVDGTASADLDRRLLRTLFRHWRFAPMGDDPPAPGWQRVRLNSADRESGRPGPGAE